jgi:hypothetical protein
LQEFCRSKLFAVREVCVIVSKPNARKMAARRESQ